MFMQTSTIAITSSAIIAKTKRRPLLFKTNFFLLPVFSLDIAVLSFKLDEVVICVDRIFIYLFVHYKQMYD